MLAPQMQCTLVRRWCYSVHCFLHWLMWQFDEMVGWYKRIAVFKSCTLPSISHWCWWMQSIDELLPGLSSPHTLLKKQSSLGKISEKGLFNKIIPSPITGHLEGEGGLRQMSSDGKECVWVTASWDKFSLTALIIAFAMTLCKYQRVPLATSVHQSIIWP